MAKSEAEKEMEERLSEWGQWKRNYLVGLGNSSNTIESQIESQEIFGDGNKRGGRKKGQENNVRFIENERAEHLNHCINILMLTHRIEASALVATYIFRWTVNNISKEMSTSRYKIRQQLKDGKSVLSSLLVNVGTIKRGEE